MARLDPQALVTHLDRLYRVAWALCGSREEAEDLVQETAARVLAKPRQLRRQDELAYLVRALRNTFLLSRRTASRRPREVATLEQVEALDRRGVGGAAGVSGPESALAARELFAVIAALPEDFRLALVAVDVAGLSYQEAADLLDTREATIASRLFRARERVVRALAPAADRGEASTPSRSLR
ncbi:MAG TPA: RNA polymerase sigma factor [Conexibacter sp.]|jgi:RNA polymerase sigma-70 factor (ECF subfamily)|nr:RNA polymerase sigma factor [Conexibacter sp.]